jgi:hypothetical protein
MTCLDRARQYTLVLIRGVIMRSEAKMENPSRLSDTELTAEVARLAWRAREATTSLIAHLAEFDARRLYLGAGFGSLFIYCVEVLRLSEHEAYNRIEAARLIRRFPVVLDRLGEGALNLTTVRLLAPHLSPDNHEELLAAAAGKTKREVEELIVQYIPRPDVPSSVRKVPAPHGTPRLPEDRMGATSDGRPAQATEPSGAGRPPEPAAPARRPEVLRPLAPDRMKSGSPRAPRPARSSGWQRTCSGTPTPTSISPMSSIAR